MKNWLHTFCLTSFALVNLSYGQSMFRGDAAHSGRMPASAPRQFHRIKWKFPTGDRIVSSPVFRTRSCISAATMVTFTRLMPKAVVKSGNARRVARCPPHQRSRTESFTPAVTMESSMPSTRKSGQLKWKFATDGERRFEAKGLHGFLHQRHQTIADPFDIFLSSPVVAQGAVYFGSGDGNVYAVDTATGELTWKFKTGDVVHCFAGIRRRRSLFRKLGQLFLRSRCRDRKRKVALSRRRRSADSQSGGIPIVARGGERRRLHRLPGFESLCTRCGDREGEVAFQQ